jgi:tripartite-type tricarboxylate transporter receptor subunit TctC
MDQMRVTKALAIMGVAALVSGFDTARAEDFYAGKRITIVCGAGVGGAYDLYSRFLADNLGRFIPGNPNIIVENRSGAGTRIGSTYVYRTAAKDGTVIANSGNLLQFDQFMFPESTRGYDLTKVQYIGNMASLTGVIALSDKAGVSSIEDVKKKTVTLGAASRFSETFIIPTVMNEVSGTKFHVVHGYVGAAEIDLAMERGEVAGRGGSWTSFRISYPEWIASGKLKPLVQIGVTEDQYMKGVPLLTSLAKNDEQRAIYGALSRGSLFSRAFWLAPEVPAERVAILRKAFDQLMKDPAFLKLADQRAFEITPTDGAGLMDATAQMQGMIGGLSKEAASRIRSILKE